MGEGGRGAKGRGHAQSTGNTTSSGNKGLRRRWGPRFSRETNGSEWAGHFPDAIGGGFLGECFGIERDG